MKVTPPAIKTIARRMRLDRNGGALAARLAPGTGQLLGLAVAVFGWSQLRFISGGKFGRYGGRDEVTFLVAEWQFEGEGGAPAVAFALDGEGAAHFPGGQRATVQAEAMAVLFGGEPVGENAGEIFGWDAHAVVGHRNPHLINPVQHAEDEPVLPMPGFFTGVPGVAHQVDQDLQDFEESGHR